MQNYKLYIIETTTKYMKIKRSEQLVTVNNESFSSNFQYFYNLHTDFYKGNFKNLRNKVELENYDL